MHDAPLRIWTGRVAWTAVRVPRILSTVAKASLLGGWLLACLAAWLAPGDGDAALGFFFFGALAPLPLLAVSYFQSLTHGARPGQIEVTPTHISVTTVRGAPGMRMLARSAIVGALVVEPKGAEPRLEIELASGDRLTCFLSEPRAAADVVGVLGFGPGGKRVRSRVGRSAGRLLHPLLANCAFVAAVTATVVAGSVLTPDESDLMKWWYLGLALSGVVYSLLRRAVRAPEVVVGDDAVRVEGGFRTRYVALGAPIGVAGRVLVDADRCAALQRLSDERAQVSMASAERRALFERDGTSVARWRERLAAALEGRSYRDAPVTVDDARATLRSPDATPEERVGAALALRIAGEPERVRVAADATANERVRVALEATLADDEAAVEKALRKLPRPA